MRFVDEKSKIKITELRILASTRFGQLVKAVVDIEKGTMVVDADLHADEEAFLIGRDSKQENLWGINIYPDILGPDNIEFDSMINLRPSQHNMTRGVDDPKIQAQVRKVVERLIIDL